MQTARWHRLVLLGIMALMATSGPAFAQFGGGSVLGTGRPKPSIAAPVLPPAPDPAVLRLMERIDGLEGAIRELTGRLETSERDSTSSRRTVEIVSKRLDELEDEIASLKTRVAVSNPVVSALPSQAAAPELAERSAPKPSVVQSQETATSPALPSLAYASAMSRLNAGDYQGAERALRAFVDAEPAAPENADARFWLGEALYVQGAYGEAAQAYVGLLRASPNATRAPDALVKLAASLRQVDQPQQACLTLAEFRKRFPKAAPSLKSRADAEAVRSTCKG